MHSSPPQADKSLSNIFDPPSANTTNGAMRSPTIPSTPAPAYTALPYRDTEFDFSPVLQGKVGDVELETTDGKKFLVHRKLLEQETVFFHIYYGFVPVWRLNSEGAQVPVPIHQGAPISAPTFNQSTHSNGTGAGALNNLLCLPKILANHITRAAASLPANTHQEYTYVPSEELPPPPPPKDLPCVTAPTPTSSPYTWQVPESSVVLLAFLSLIYPRGTFTSHPEELLTSLELTGRVVRAALGYQSSKALNLSRDRLSHFINDKPVGVYALATFYKFHDLAKLASELSLAVPIDQWPNDARVLMGRNGAAKLIELQRTRLESLRIILNTPMEEDDHSKSCVRKPMIEHLWKDKVNSLIQGGLGPESDLIELLEVDLRGGHCGDCLVVLGKTIQRCMLEARELTKSI